MKISLAQYNFTVGDFQGNVKKILEVTQEARKQGAALVVFPELCLSGYIPEDLLLREDFLDAAAQALHHLTEKISDPAIVVGCPIKKLGKVYNCAVVLHRQRQIACYAKQILPNYGVFDEKRYFSSGTESCVFQLNSQGPKFGLLICEDLWSTEPAVRAKQAGADMLLSIHASPFSIDKETQRKTVYREACRASQLPLLAILLIGAQDDLCFDGGSRALNAKGECVLQAEFFKEELLMVETAIEKNLVVMPATCQPTLAGIQSSINKAYLDACQRRLGRSCYDRNHEIPHIYQALVLGIRDYVHKNHFKGAFLGLSGGIDSALTLVLAIDALGVENVTPVIMPSRYTSELSMKGIQEQLKLTGAQGITLSIEPLFEASLATLHEEFKNLKPDKTEENLQARCRGILLMALSNKTGKIVLTTGNKSEMATGYATLYGDMAGGFSALKDVYKTRVFELARYRNTLGDVIPQRVIDRPPSAELAPNQKDEDSLPPYIILDGILQRYIDHQQSIQEIVQAGFDRATVERVVKMLHRNEYKRRQSPLGIKITEISFTRDRRYPTTSGDWYVA